MYKQFAREILEEFSKSYSKVDVNRLAEMIENFYLKINYDRKVNENNIVYIVVAKCLKDSYKEIQLVTKNKQYAIDFVENNYCGFQAHIFDLVYIKAFALNAYLGKIDDYIEKDEHELILNPKYESLSYYWDWDNNHFVKGIISINYLQKRLYI